jgi:hypothetical protein
LRATESRPGGSTSCLRRAARWSAWTVVATLMRNSDPTRHASDPAEHTNALRRAQIPVLTDVGDKDPPPVRRTTVDRDGPRWRLVVLSGEDHASALLSQAYKKAVASLLTPHALRAPEAMLTVSAGQVWGCVDAFQPLTRLPFGTVPETAFTVRPAEIAPQSDRERRINRTS